MLQMEDDPEGQDRQAGKISASPISRLKAVGCLGMANSFFGWNRTSSCEEFCEINPEWN